MELIKNNKKIVGGIIILAVALIVFGCFYYFNDAKANNVYAEAQECICDCEASSKEFYVDIKGAVKKPGVYLVNENTIIKDVIEMAGGLKSTATTDNINLSQKVTSEMVIYICTKTELKKQKENQTTTTTTQTTTSSSANEYTTNNQNVTSACDPGNVSTNTEQKTLVNINTASKEELMTIPNIGASKADSIIVYRTENKFTKIEDIMNVSGIGETLFVKIKDYITV